MDQKAGETAMGQAPSISIIMPIYNAQDTVDAAVAAICEQSMSDFELLLIDDGSTDASAAHCASLVQQDSRLRLICQENAGICAARNRGIQEARGEYLTFCDDDDTLLPDALRTMLVAARRERVDLVRTGYRILRQRQDGSYQELPHPEGKRCTLSAARKGYASFLRQSGPQFVWNALYRREAVSQVRFDPRCRYGLEDFLYNAEVYKVIRSAVYLPEVTYLHYEHDDSTSLQLEQAAVEGRVEALTLWVQAEWEALSRWEKGSSAAWAERQTQFVTFLMHQLRDSKAPASLRSSAWEALRRAMAEHPAGRLDFLRLARQNKKEMIALLLYQMHWQGLYRFLPDKEGK